MIYDDPVKKQCNKYNTSTYHRWKYPLLDYVLDTFGVFYSFPLCTIVSFSRSMICSLNSFTARWSCLLEDI